MASYRRQFSQVEFNVYVAEVAKDQYDGTAYKSSSIEPYEKIHNARSEEHAVEAITAVLERLFGPVLQS